MSSEFITYDFAVPVSYVEAFASADFSYIRKVVIVCVNKDETAENIEVVDVTGKTGLTEKTDAQGVTALIDGGLSGAKLVLLPQSDVTITSAQETLSALENQALTVFIANGVTGTSAEISQNARMGSLSVIVKSFTDQQITEAEVLATTDCAFIDNDPALGGMYYAFASMLSGASWSNQQFLIQSGVTATTVTVGDSGTAETYFNSRLSFFIDDSSLGRNLGFFGAGLSSIVDNYIRAEIGRKLQQTGVEYIQANEPNNTENVRELLTLELRSVFTSYENDGLINEGASVVNITGDSTDDFTAVGSFEMDLPKALWRLKVQLKS